MSMNRGALSVAMLVASFCWQFVACTGGTIAGGTSETTNGVIAAVETTDGAPAVGVTVRMRRADYVTPLPSLPKTRALSSADTITNADGRFEITDIDPGDYRIEITDNISSAVLLSCTIEVGDTADLGTVTLQPFASIAGTIDSLTESAYVQIRGLERLVPVDTSDSFAVYDLPAATFDLRVVTVGGASTEQTDIAANAGDTTPVVILPQWLYAPDGYAEGTTGGGSAAPVTVSSAAAFEAAAGDDNPAVIIVDGRLDIGDFLLGSNKTIMGRDSTSGLYGGCVRVAGRNCIFQNLTFGPSGTDAMELTGATNVFIRKCEFYDAGDGLLDIVRESDLVTISWCKFYYVDQTAHRNVMLIGNSDDASADSGKLHVTLHHNWYADSCDSYMPRVRYGHVHIYNNYYNSAGNNYCIGLGVHSRIRVENTCFDSVNAAWDDLGGMASDGQIGWSGLRFDNTATPTFAPNSFPVFTPPYTFSLDPVDDVRALVQAGAGNR
jgi:pectate lyase